MQEQRRRRAEAPSSGPNQPPLDYALEIIVADMIELIDSSVEEYGRAGLVPRTPYASAGAFVTSFLAAIRSMKSSESASTSLRTDATFGSATRSSFASPWTVLQMSAEIFDGSAS